MDIDENSQAVPSLLSSAANALLVQQVENKSGREIANVLGIENVFHNK